MLILKPTNGNLAMTTPDHPTYRVTVRTERANPQTGQQDNQSGYHVARDANGDWRAYGKFDGVKTDQQLAEYIFHADEIAAVGIDANGDLTIDIYKF